VVAPAAAAEALRVLLSRTAPQGRAAEQLALADFLRNGQFALHVRRMRRLYRHRRDATVAALEKHLGTLATVHGASAGMHLALRLHDAKADDMRIAAMALEQGVVAQALSAHSTGARAHGWNGFLLGYSQVPAEDADGLVKRLAALVRAA
jgi:GntR family transcriptional regulator/MocR family aminotransferase